MATPTEVLGQFLVVALLVERVTTLGRAVLSTNNDPAPGAGEKIQVKSFIAAAVISIAICHLYKFGLLMKLLGGSDYNIAELFDIIFSSIVIAGGSAGIAQIMAAIRETSKAAASEARARLLIAQRELTLLHAA